MFRQYFGLNVVFLIFIIVLAPVSAQQQFQLFLGRVEFDRFDFSSLQNNNQTEKALVWSNNTPIFENQQDQVKLNYTVETASIPLSVTCEFVTQDTPILDNKPTGFFIYISQAITVNHLLVGSTVILTINWHDLLNTSKELDSVNYTGITHDYVRRDYQIYLSLSTNTTWSQDAVIQYTASYSTRIKQLNSTGFDVDVSHAVTGDTSPSNLSTTKTTPLKVLSVFVLIPITQVKKKKRYES